MSAGGTGNVQARGTCPSSGTPRPGPNKPGVREGGQDSQAVQESGGQVGAGAVAQAAEGVQGRQGLHLPVPGQGRGQVRQRPRPVPGGGRAQQGGADVAGAGQVRQHRLAQPGRQGRTAPPGGGQETAEVVVSGGGQSGAQAHQGRHRPAQGRRQGPGLEQGAGPGQVLDRRAQGPGRPGQGASAPSPDCRPGQPGCRANGPRRPRRLPPAGGRRAWAGGAGRPPWPGPPPPIQPGCGSGRTGRRPSRDPRRPAPGTPGPPPVRGPPRGGGRRPRVR